MNKPVPVVYILHGDDEHAISRFVKDIQSRLDDPGAAMLNVLQIDGRSVKHEELQSAVSAIPFLSERRIVILNHPLVRLNNQDAQEQFIELLNQIPATTALVIVENKPLTGEKKKRIGDFHWLEAWAEATPERAYIREFRLPKGGALVRWIMDRAEAEGGSFSPRAAAYLASLVGEDTRLAELEIQKLVVYVNFQRMVEVDDVEALTAAVPQGDIFAMVDALGNQNGRRSMQMLGRLLDTQEPISIFGMVVRQFRLLLLAREILDNGGVEKNVARDLQIHPFVAGKVAEQARHFRIEDLETIYRCLLDFDERVKTGRIKGDLALETFVAGITG